MTCLSGFWLYLKGFEQRTTPQQTVSLFLFLVNWALDTCIRTQSNPGSNTGGGVFLSSSHPHPVLTELTDSSLSLSLPPVPTFSFPQVSFFYFFILFQVGIFIHNPNGMSDFIRSISFVLFGISFSSLTNLITFPF